MCGLLLHRSSSIIPAAVAFVGVVIAATWQKEVASGSYAILCLLMAEKSAAL